jgi:hypothetical protein
MFNTWFQTTARRSGLTRQCRRRLLALELFEDRTMLDATPWASFAHDAQHTGLSSVAAQDLGVVRWQTPVDLHPPSALAIHYGSPVITQADTLLVPVKTTTNGGFRVEARSPRDGTLRWTLPTDYILPAGGGWTPSYNITLTRTNRLYFPGAGGTVYYTDTPDAANTPTPVQVAFYGISHYDHSLDSKILINTPLTADQAGNVYFGFVVTGTTSLNLKHGIARLQPDGTGTWVAASTAAGQTGNDNYKVATNSAPALSNDGRILYVALNGGGPGYLAALNSTTLAPISRVQLQDVEFPTATAQVPDISTASPMVGPDGDVYFGVLEHDGRANHNRGWLLHFSGDLAQTKGPGAFGWDSTPSVVPRGAVPSYQGTSPYLLMSKYNNYRQVGGDGVSRIAILDPDATMRDPITGATVMNEVLTIAGVTPDPVLPAVREWCINNAAVDPITKSVLVNSEDGYLYRWDLTTNSFTERIQIAWGVGEAYTPTVVGVDGTVYAINNATLWAVQSPAGPSVTAVTPAGNLFGDVSHVRVTLNEPIDPASFTPAKVVSFVGPSGPGIPITAVTPVAGTANTQFDLTFPTQHALGNYIMTIGPDVRDPAGHAMDQNGNGIPGEIPGDQYILRFTIQGPKITADSLLSDPYAPNQLNLVRFTFNESMNPATFTADQVVLAGPSGRIPIAAVNPVSGTTNRQFDILFPAPITRTGTYTLTIGPNVRDTAGHQMDQNGNFTEGEVPGDQYITRFGVSGPKIMSSNIAGPYVPGQLRDVLVSFSEVMDPATFTPSTILFLGPRGPVGVNAIAPVAGSNNTQFDIQLDPVGGTGRYYLWIGPDIRDTFGNPMDQNGNLIPGEVPGDEYQATFSVLGPRVTSQSPTTNILGQVSSVRLGFNFAMVPGSFTPDQVSLTGPNGPVPVTSVFPVGGSNNTQFDLTFEPQTATGVYTLVVGPYILDVYGNAMDQNGNLIPGEIPGDQYSGTFGIQGPRITSSSNYGTLARGVGSVRVTFNESMDPGTFTPDQVASFTDPVGNPVTVTDVRPVPFSDNTQFDILFDPAELAGTYTMVLGPYILDPYGNPMDQNGNLIPGEIPGDQFTATFSVPAPKLVASAPSGTLHGPVASVQVTFDTPMNPDTFTTDYVTSFIGPGGIAIPVTDVEPIPDTNNTQFQISFDPQSASGQYQMVLGAGIQDVYGGATDRSFTVQFTLTSATLVLTVGTVTSQWNDGSFVIIQETAAQFAGQDLSGFDVIWVEGSVLGSPVLYARAADLAAFVDRGGGLLAEYNLTWGWVPNAASLSFNGLASGNAVTVTAQGMSHPVTAGLTDAGLSNWGYSYDGFFALTGGIGVLATTTYADQAVMLAGTFGDGRLVYFAGEPSNAQLYGVGQSQQLMRQAARWVSGRGAEPARLGPQSRKVAVLSTWPGVAIDPGVPGGLPGTLSLASSPTPGPFSGREANPILTLEVSPMLTGDSRLRGGLPIRRRRSLACGDAAESPQAKDLRLQLLEAVDDLFAEETRSSANRKLGRPV